MSEKILKVDAANDLALLKAVGAFKPLPIAASHVERDPNHPGSTPTPAPVTPPAK